MNLDMFGPKNETQDLLLSVTKKCETLLKKIYTKSQETLEFNLTQSRETFPFKPCLILGLDFKWMIGLACLELYNFIFNIAKENNKFEFYTNTSVEFSLTQLKDEPEEILDFSNIPPDHLQDKISGTRNFQSYENDKQEREFLMLITCYYCVVLDLHSEILKVILES